MDATVLLLRHAETQADRLRLFLGRREIPESALSQGAADRLRALSPSLAPFAPAVALHGPERRSEETARRLAAQLGIPTRLEPALCDVDLGRAGGQLKRLWLVRHPPRRGNWRLDYLNFPFPEGESLREAFARLRATFEAWRDAPPTGCQLLVVHDLLLPLILALLLDQPRDRFLDLLVGPCGCVALQPGAAGRAWRLLPAPEQELWPPSPA